MTMLGNLREGDRIVLSSGTRWSSPMERPWLTTGSHHGLVVTTYVSHADGNVVCRDEGDRDAYVVPTWRIAWGGAIPDLADDGVISVIGASLDAVEAPVLIHIVDTRVGRIFGIAMMPDEQPGLQRQDRVSELMQMHLRDLHVQQGDLLVAMGHEITFENGVAVHAFAHAERLAEDVTMEEARRIVTERPAGRRDIPRLADMHDLERRRQLAWEGMNPDQALVLVSQGAHSWNNMQIVASSGRTLAESADPEADLCSNDSPGLWMVRDLKWWSSESHEGEKDGGMEGVWTPATAADAEAFGLEPGDVERLLRTYDDPDAPHGGEKGSTFEHYCRMATASTKTDA